MLTSGYQASSDASIGVFDPRGVRQMDALAHPLGSLPAGIKEKHRFLKPVLLYETSGIRTPDNLIKSQVLYRLS